MRPQNIVEIDGRYYNARIPEDGIKRKFQILDDDSAGRVGSGEMYRSIIGTYYNYTIQFDTLGMDPDEYDALYNVLSSPVDYHVITVPYGQETLTFNAYITAGEDSLKVVRRGVNSWNGLSVDFVAMGPQRT